MQKIKFAAAVGDDQGFATKADGIKNVMGKEEAEGKAINFWQDHSLHYLEMAFRSDKHERIEHPDGYGKRTGECGDMVEMFLRVENNRIQSLTFDIDGCMNTKACSNTVVHMAEGKTTDQAWDITPEAVIDYLETLPAHETHCAELAVGALYLALSDYRETQSAPWKKIYKKS